jgi:peptidoglycan/LPS O-acetylase OafA/YrhL
MHIRFAGHFGHRPGSKAVFCILVGLLVAVADGVRLPGLGGSTLVGRAGYSIYALHAPLTYTLAIYRVPWWLNIAANIFAGLAMHFLIERPLIDIGRAVRFKMVHPLSV